MKIKHLTIATVLFTCLGLTSSALAHQFNYYYDSARYHAPAKIKIYGKALPLSRHVYHSVDWAGNHHLRYTHVPARTTHALAHLGAANNLVSIGNKNRYFGRTGLVEATHRHQVHLILPSRYHW